MTMIPVCTFDIDTREYINQYNRDASIKTRVTNDRTLDPVIPEKKGFTRLRNLNNTEWYYQIDLRGQKQYSIADGTESEIDYIGDIKHGYSLDPKPAKYFVFDQTKNKWLKDAGLYDAYFKQYKITAQDTINNAVNAVYADYDRFKSEYLIREQQARAWVADNNSQDLSFVVSFSDAANLSIAEACSIIIMQADKAYAALNRLQKDRMRKIEIDRLTTSEAIDAHVEMLLEDIAQAKQALN